MNKIALMIGETFLYWNSIFLVLGTLTALFLFLGFYIGRSGNVIGAFLLLPPAFLLSLFLGRLIHWYCKADLYSSVEAALSDYTQGSYALCGVFAGCLLAACLLRLLRIVKDLPQLLDALAPAAAAGIGAGRLGSLFTDANRGDIVEYSAGLPWVWPVPNAVTGAPENRLAVFMLQALGCALIFGILTVFWLIRRKSKYRGDTFLLFLLQYGAMQAVLDSMRYDSLYLRSNGFVSLVQILGALCVLLALAVFSVNTVRRRGWRWGYLGIWIGAAALLGCAGYMEYHVQRHGDQSAFGYTVMSCCLLGVVILGWILQGLSHPKMEKTRARTGISG